MKTFKITQPELELKPTRSSYLPNLADKMQELIAFISDSHVNYHNPELEDFLSHEVERLYAYGIHEFNLWLSAQDERERAAREANIAAKKKELEGRLNVITGQADKVKALDLIDKLSKLGSGTELYCEYEIELDRLFRFYEAVSRQ